MGTAQAQAAAVEPQTSRWVQGTRFGTPEAPTQLSRQVAAEMPCLLGHEGVQARQSLALLPYQIADRHTGHALGNGHHVLGSNNR